MKRAKTRVVSLLGAAFTRLLFATTRVRRLGAEHYLELRKRGQPVVFVFWHGQMFPLVYYHRGEGIVVLVSEHSDGEYITRIIERLGFGTVRGSSTRGGAKGLKGLIRSAREGHDLAVTPDGPQGPAGQVQPGALLAAQMSGAPIVPLAVGATSAWRLTSWDRFMVPKPFSTVTIAYGEPIEVSGRASAEDREELRARVRSVLDDLGRRAGAGPVSLPAPAVRPEGR